MDMATTTAVAPSRAVLVDCVRTAMLAPSLHNSQPWRFRIERGAVDVYADRGRRLTVLDPDGRELMLSVGAAVLTLRLAMLRSGFLPAVDLFPDADETDLIARVTADYRVNPTGASQALADAVARRHTNRWPFIPAAVPGKVLDKLRQAARSEGAHLAVAGPAAREAVLSLACATDGVLRARAGYRAELDRWAGVRPGERDGVPPWAIGPDDSTARMPVRHFGQALSFPIPARRFEPQPTLLLLTTSGDSVFDHLMAGQALQRVLLTATCLGLATTPISQPVELHRARRQLTGPESTAQMVLRVGYGRQVRATPRRPLEDVLLLPPRGRSARTSSGKARSRSFPV